jgi:CRISPR-associated endonuclease Cas2
MQYLIGYDITEPRRLQKVHKKMTKYATPLQYSVFLFEGKQRELSECLDVILAMINKKEDDLRVYPLPSGTKKWHLGKPILPEGIIWTALPFNY